MSVCTVIRGSHRTTEAPFPYAVSGFGLYASIGPGTNVDVCTYSVFLHLTGNNVNNPTHGVRTIKHGCGATEHFHTFCHHSLICIGNGVSHQSHILRMSVNQNQ